MAALLVLLLSTCACFLYSLLHHCCSSGKSLYFGACYNCLSPTLSLLPKPPFSSHLSQLTATLGHVTAIYVNRDVCQLMRIPPLVLYAWHVMWKMKITPASILWQAVGTLAPALQWGNLISNLINSTLCSHKIVKLWRYFLFSQLLFVAVVDNANKISTIYAYIFTGAWQCNHNVDSPLNRHNIFRLVSHEIEIVMNAISWKVSLTKFS